MGSSEFLVNFAELMLLIVGIILAILWILLPFAVFGIRSRVDAISQTMTQTDQNVLFLVHETKKLHEGILQLKSEMARTNQILCAVHNVKIEDE